MSTPRITFKKKILFLVVTVFIGTLAGLLIGEAALRMAGPVWLRQFMVGTNLDGQIRYGSDGGWPVDSWNGKFVRFKPLKEFKVDFYEYHTIIHTDKWGGRLVPGARQSNDNTFIPVLGDSFVFGLGVKDEETFVSLLSQKSDIFYLNLGVPGSSLPNDLDIIEMRHKELGSPSIYIIAFYLGNDFGDMMNYYAAPSEQENQKNKDSTRRFLDFISQFSLFQRSYLAHFFSHSSLKKNENKHRPKLFRGPDGQRLGNSLYLLMSGHRVYCTLAHNVLDRSLARLETLSKTLHFRPIFIVIPDKQQTDKSLFNKQAAIFHLSPSELDPTLPNHILEENLEERGITYFDVMPCLKDRPGLYYKIDDHLTAAGHRVVADCINQDSKWQAIAELRIGAKR